MFRSLFDETGEFILSWWGAYSALIFRGDKDFLFRMHNLCKNYGMLKNGGWYRLDDNECDIRCCYILAPEEKMKESLARAFEWEVIQQHKNEINYKFVINESGEEANYEVTWDEKKVAELALESVERFWEERIIKDNILPRLKAKEENWEFPEYKVGYKVSLTLPNRSLL